MAHREVKRGPKGAQGRQNEAPGAQKLKHRRRWVLSYEARNLQFYSKKKYFPTGEQHYMAHLGMKKENNQKTHQGGLANSNIL